MFAFVLKASNYLRVLNKATFQSYMAKGYFNLYSRISGKSTTYTLSGKSRYLLISTHKDATGYCPRFEGWWHLSSLRLQMINLLRTLTHNRFSLMLVLIENYFDKHDLWIFTTKGINKANVKVFIHVNCKYFHNLKCQKKMIAYMSCINY